MHPIKIGILEDDFIIATTLQKFLHDLGYTATDVASTFEEAEALVKDESPDLMLVDIRLKNESRDGIDFAVMLREQYSIPAVFVTANSDAGTIQRAKQASPVAYLLKPFDKQSLYVTLEVALHNEQQRMAATLVPEETPEAVTESPRFAHLRDAMFIKQGQQYVKITHGDILFLESDNMYVNIHTAGRKYLVRSSLTNYLEYLKNDMFYRVHRGYAVNLRFVTGLESDHLMVSGHQVPIGKMYRQEVMNLLGIF